MNHEKIVFKFFEAAGDLLTDGFDRLRTTDQAGFSKVSQAVSDGGTITLTCAVGTGGSSAVRCALHLADGSAVELFRLEAGAPVWN